MAHVMKARPAAAIKVGQERRVMLSPRKRRAGAAMVKFALVMENVKKVAVYARLIGVGKVAQ
jgi:hypothetical protein